MKLVVALLAGLLLATGIITARAQGISPNPQASVPTATGTISGVADFVWNGSAWVASTGGGSTAGSVGTAGTNGTTAQSVQGITGGVPQPTLTTPGTRTLVPLDVATVTTGGTAVTALTAGHRSAGGFLYNPSTATINLCISEVATASGTTSAGSLICIPPDRTYQLTPSANTVSVVSSDSAHAFAGFGYQ